MRGSWGLAKMPVHLSSLAKTRIWDSATALMGIQGHMVQGEDVTPSVEDVAPGTAAHTKCTHLQFWHLLDIHVIIMVHHYVAILARKLHLLDQAIQGSDQTNQLHLELSGTEEIACDSHQLAPLLVLC